MNQFTNYETLSVAGRDMRQNYQTLISCVVPRPIAFVTTLSPTGVVNLAPFSFFNGVSGHPPAVMFAPANDRHGREKDTLANLRQIGEFVVNIVPHAIADAMNETSFTYPRDVSELDVCGFTALSSTQVRPPRVAESPVQLECRLMQIVDLGGGPLAGHVCIGEVLCFHIAAGFLAPDGAVDPAKLDAIARMGGDWYATTRDRFRMPRPIGPKSSNGGESAIESSPQVPHRP
jgi:flavin reductase (DIM6/NTAB) family NADH-FMN oxidoreductase RutF